MQRQEILQLKSKFLEDCIKKEGKKLREKADRDWNSNTPRFSYLHYPNEYEILLARKDHKCLRRNCGKTIKKGSFYFRRSFGRLWTIKACSIECFCWELP